MAYDDIIVGPTGTGILRATFGLPVKAAIDDIDGRINAFEGSTKMKKVTTAFASQTSFQNDPELVFDLAPNSSYKIEWCFFHQAPAAADIKFDWTGMTWGSAGVNGFFRWQSNVTPASGLSLWSNAGTAVNLASTGSPTVDYYAGWGGLVTGAVGGTIRPRYAQQVSNATNLQVFISSYMTVTRVEIL